MPKKSIYIFMHLRSAALGSWPYPCVLRMGRTLFWVEIYPGLLMSIRSPKLQITVQNAILSMK